MCCVAGAVVGVGQKVKHRTIVPDIGASNGPIACHVHFDPLHGGRFWTETCPRTIERGTRNIENGHAARTPVEYRVHEAGIPTPDVNDSGLRSEPDLVDQPQRRCGLLLKPTDARRRFRSEYFLPMVFPIHESLRRAQSAGDIRDREP